MKCCIMCSPCACHVTNSPFQMMSPVFPDHQRTTVSHSGHRRVPQSSGHPPTHVAFGEKVAIPDHILARQVGMATHVSNINSSYFNPFLSGDE